MRFVYDPHKAAESAAYLLSRSGGTMKYISLLKLMYLADRLAFVESGYPITGAKMVSMDKGPVLSEVYRDITWGDGVESPWSQLITAPANYEVSLRGEVGELLHLSEYDEEVLDRTLAKYRNWDRWDLVRFTHQLPEWQDPEGSSLPIDTRTILEEAGKSDGEIHAIAAQVESIRAMHQAAMLGT